MPNRLIGDPVDIDAMAEYIYRFALRHVVVDKKPLITSPGKLPVDALMQARVAATVKSSPDGIDVQSCSVDVMQAFGQLLHYICLELEKRGKLAVAEQFGEMVLWGIVAEVEMPVQ